MAIELTDDGTQFHNPRGYKINDAGVIQNPGKYEAEMIYVPYFAESDNATDAIDQGEDVCPIDVYEIDDDDRAKFPGLLDDVFAVCLQTDSNGFCSGREFETEAELTRFRAEAELSDEDRGPQEEDITTEDHETFYQNGKRQLWRDAPESGSGLWFIRLNPTSFDTLGAFGNDHKAALRAYMERTQFWPNCWFISDHGNAHLMDLSEGK